MPADRVFGLDLLRCLAILCVVGAHTSRRYLRFGGTLGVELFFVLSGFLIGGIILRSFDDAPSPRDVVGFWVRRWFRTLPCYYLFFVVNLVVWARAGRPLRPTWSYAVFLQNLAWSPGPFFRESWSLAVEEWFYLLFPILFFLVTRIRPGKVRAAAWALAILFAASTLGRVAAVLLGNPSFDSGIRQVVVYRFDALMLGVLGALLQRTRPGPWSRLRVPGAVAGSVLFALAITGFLSLDRSHSFFARTLLLPLLSTSVLLWLPALEAWRDARGPLAVGVREVSLASYSLYLCHGPVHQLLVFLGSERVLGEWAAALVFVVVAQSVASLNYRLFERPVMELRERFAGFSAGRPAPAARRNTR